MIIIRHISHHFDTSVIDNIRTYNEFLEILINFDILDDVKARRMLRLSRWTAVVLAIEIARTKTMEWSKQCQEQKTRQNRQGALNLTRDGQIIQKYIVPR